MTTPLSLRKCIRIAVILLSLPLMLGGCSQADSADDDGNNNGSSNGKSAIAAPPQTGTDQRGVCYQGALVQHNLFTQSFFYQVASEQGLVFNGSARAALDAWPPLSFKAAGPEISSCQSIP